MNDYEVAFLDVANGWKTIALVTADDREEAVEVALEHLSLQICADTNALEESEITVKEQ